MYKNLDMIKEEVISTLSLQKESSILEVEPSNTTHIEVLSKSLSSGHIHIMSRSPDFVHVNQAKHKNLSNLSFVLGDGKTFVFPKKFHTILSFSDLLWVHTLSSFFRDLYENLLSKGTCILRFPIHMDKHIKKTLDTEEFSKLKKDSKKHFHTRKEVEEALLSLPFRDFLLLPFEATKPFFHPEELTHWLMTDFTYLSHLQEDERLIWARKISSSLMIDEAPFTLKIPYLHVECEK